MAILKVAQMGHPILRQVSKKVEIKEITHPSTRKLIADMIETMREYNGVGLAAPQVHESLQIAVMEINDNPRYPDEETVPVTVFINPVITPLTEELMEVWEGCLSVPGMRGAVKRPSKIRLQALNERGEQIDKIYEGFSAIAVQHETDHLFGVLYVDRLVDSKQFAFTPEYLKYHLTVNEVDDEAEAGVEV
jgi:peptide deformylase